MAFIVLVNTCSCDDGVRLCSIDDSSNTADCHSMGLIRWSGTWRSQAIINSHDDILVFVIINISGDNIIDSDNYELVTVIINYFRWWLH